MLHSSQWSVEYPALLCVETGPALWTLGSAVGRPGTESVAKLRLDYTADVLHTLRSPCFSHTICWSNFENHERNDHETVFVQVRKIQAESLVHAWNATIVF